MSGSGSARLTAGQRSTFRRAYRDAYATSDSYATLDALYSKYQDLYGVSREVLLQIVTEDHQRNRQQYIALHAVRAQQKRQRRRTQAQERKTQSEPTTPEAVRTEKSQARAGRRAKRRADEAAQREAERQRALADPGYYTQATNCPVCRTDLGREYMPPHEDRPSHRCQGSGRFGVTRASFHRKAKEDSRADRDWVTKPGTVSGGLPSLGRKRRR